MRARSLLSLVAAVAASLSLAACGSDSPVAPKQQQPIAPAPAASNSLLGTLLGAPTTVVPLQRNHALAAPITVSQRIGILGGVIAIPQAGITIVVPPLAIPSPKTITVTALAGSSVAYEFEPHGTHFNLPLVMTQNLVGTQAQAGGLINALNLQVGYFPDASHINSVTELLNVGVSIPGQIGITTLWHFSGYVWVSGRDGGDDMY